MSSDQLNPNESQYADPSVQRRVPSESEVVERLQDLWGDSPAKSPSPLIDSEPKHINRFQIVRMLGQGGMGRVYLGIDSELGREVAIKVPLFDHSSDPTAMERFRREGRAAGAVNHPNLVAIHEVGDMDQGCYIVSEYIQGPTLRDYLQQRGHPMEPRAAARMIMTIARGVHAAHQHGVIHRDLKPSNILLERLPSNIAESGEEASSVAIDGDCFRPRIADFGLACIDDQRTAITMSGALVGTPSYMAPEQITGASLGPQADTFAMGVMLYEFITGRSPFSAESYAATIDRVQNHDPPSLVKTNSGFPRDLSAICECAINKEPIRRYLTAGELADDLTRFLVGKPVRARSLGPAGRIQRWVRRHPIHAALAVVICIALTWSLFQNRRLQASLEHSDQLKDQMAVNALELRSTNESYRETIYVQDMIQAYDALNRNAVDDVRSLLFRHMPAESGTDLRGIEWFALNELTRADTPRAFSGHVGEVYDIAVTLDGKYFFSVGEDKRRRFWDLDSGEIIRIADPELIGKSHAIALSPDGNTFYTGGNFLRSHLVADGAFTAEQPITHHPYGIRAVEVSPDNRYVASLCFQHQIHLNSIDPNQPYAKNDFGVPAQHSTRIDFSPDSKHLYFTRRDKSIDGVQPPCEFVVWDIARQQEIFAGEPIAKYGERFGPVDCSGDGRLVAIGGERSVQLFDAKNMRFIRRVHTGNHFVLDVEFSPNCNLLAMVGHTGVLSVCRAVKHRDVTLRPIYEVRPHNSPINTMAWVNDRQLLTGDSAGRILLHSLRDSVLSKVAFDSHTCHLHADGKTLVTIDRNGIGRLVDVDSFRTLHQITGLNTEPPECVSIDPASGWLAVSYDNQLQIWNLNENQLQTQMIHRPISMVDGNVPYQISSISIAPDGQKVATSGSVDGTVLEWDIKTGSVLREVGLPNDSMGSHASYSPVGNQLLCAGGRGAFVLNVDVGTKSKITNRRVHDSVWLTETRLLIYSTDGLIKVVDTTSTDNELVFSHQGIGARKAAVSPDKRTLVTLVGSQIYFWNIPSMRMIGSIHMRAESICFSPNGDKLYATVRDQESDSFRLRVFSK